MPEVRKLSDLPKKTEWQNAERPITKEGLEFTAGDWLGIGLDILAGGPIAGAMSFASKCWDVQSAMQGIQFLFYFTATIKNFVEIWDRVVNSEKGGFSGENAEKLVSCLCRVSTACGNPPEGVEVPDQALSKILRQVADRLALYQRDENGAWVLDQDNQRIPVGEVAQVVEEMQAWVKSQYYKYNETDEKAYSTVESVTKLLIDGYIRHNQS